ncbi:MAG: molybdenum cofactor biosynthesis F family protein [Oscillospiraceae bacterium]|nr:molybdenum cofactor biosynthesis F family protein [Oscillospiraceae bacterium]
MFRLDYTKLNLEQVRQAVESRKAPDCATELCDRMAGKTLKIILDPEPVRGPTLEYTFLSATKLTVKEDGGEAIPCDYGALSLKDLTLFSHMVAGTMRGYNVILDRKTRVVTVFEVWFVDRECKVPDMTKTFYEMQQPFDYDLHTNREVQRQYYSGYFEAAGEAAPEQRNKLTLRLENCMIKWKEDRGRNRLTTYTSSMFSTVVELDTPDGGDVLTFTSDILQANESSYIHSLGEVEFSGRLAVEVVDLFTMSKIGVCIGIDENDAFEHTLYRGRGRHIGRYAAFYDFNDKGDRYPDGALRRMDLATKGARATYRPSIMAKQLTADEVTNASRNTYIFDPEKEKSNNFCKIVLDETDYCAGREVTFRGDDGYDLELRFKADATLECRASGETRWSPEPYRAMELDEDLIIIGFYRSGSNPPACVNLALDFKNGLATCITMKIGSKHDMHDVDPDYHFGIIETAGVTPVRIFRHGFTDELLGRAFTWTYSDNISSIHIYNAPHSYSWTIINSGEPGSPANRAGGYVWSSPCEYIKLRDDVYIMAFVEQKWDGLTDVFFMNLRIMRDVGFEFGISHDGTSIQMNKVGAIARSAGTLDLKSLYPFRSYNAKS